MEIFSWQRTVNRGIDHAFRYRVTAIAKNREAHMEYPIVIEPDPEAGGYVVSCPTLKGCVSQGETEEEALENLRMRSEPTSQASKT